MTTSINRMIKLNLQHQLRTEEEMWMSIWSPFLTRRNERRHQRMRARAVPHTSPAYLLNMYPINLKVFYKVLTAVFTLEIRFSINAHMAGFQYDLQMHVQQQLRSLISCSVLWIIMPSRIRMRRNTIVRQGLDYHLN